MRKLVVAAFVAVVFVACGPNWIEHFPASTVEETETTPPASTPVNDGGSVDVDGGSGCPIEEPEVDAGTPPVVDAGSPEVDAGTPDSGTPDAGQPEDDGKPGKTLLCHVPRGNPGNAHNIYVGYPAVRAHLAHGDYLGLCRKGHN